MNGVLFPAQIRVDLPDLQAESEMRRLEKHREFIADGLENGFPSRLLLGFAAAAADAEGQVDEAIVRQKVGDRVIGAADRAHPDGAELEKAGAEDRLVDGPAKPGEVDAVVEIARVFDCQVRHLSSRCALIYLTR
ncbi:hypothetical protein D9M72_549520 [compost metagenome]